MGKPIVSIFMLTYNQENFIAQAIEGVLMQKTNFKYQLVIGEDGSSDKTLEICNSYQKKYPNLIKVIAQPINIGLMPNFIKTYKYLTGKYIAICDGDDYWIDPLKLQKQVEVLENSNNVSMVYSRTKKEYQNGEVISVPLNHEINSKKNAETVISGNFIPSVTVMLRAENLPTLLPTWFSTLPYGDWPLYMYALSDGSEVHFINEELTVYRTGIGESHKLYRNLEKTFKTELRILKFISAEPQFKDWQHALSEAIKNVEIKIMLIQNKENRFLKGLFLFTRLFVISKNRMGILNKYLYSLKKKVTPC